MRISYVICDQENDFMKGWFYEWNDFNQLGQLIVPDLFVKVQTFWEGHKILRNLYLTFVLCSASQN